jgi:16S rRNA (cytosine1402-N4)-methyltransferase
VSDHKTTDKTEDMPHRRRIRYSGTHPKRFAEKYKEHAIDEHPELLEHLRDKGKTPAGTHIPIMTEKILAALTPSPGESAVDCTLGYGGHAAAFLERIGPSGTLIGLDIDGTELTRTKKRLSSHPGTLRIYRCNFAGLGGILQKRDWMALISSLPIWRIQYADRQSARGLSYKHDGPLDMRMDDRRPKTAADLLATLDEGKLSEALRELADEPDHAAIARDIVDARQTAPLTRIAQLVELILAVKGLTLKDWKRQVCKTPGLLHPAARTFQALRMLVNDELGALKSLLRAAPYCLRPGGRIGIISFHSGEDRLVKKAFAEGLREGFYKTAASEVIVSDRDEIDANPRSRSAKFRWAKT